MEDPEADHIQLFFIAQSHMTTIFGFCAARSVVSPMSECRMRILE